MTSRQYYVFFFMNMEHLSINLVLLWPLSSEFYSFPHINLTYVVSYLQVIHLVRFITKYFILGCAYVNYNALISNNTCSLLVYRKVIDFCNIINLVSCNLAPSLISCRSFFWICYIGDHFI